MEEKERYEIDKSTNYYTNTIVDTKTNTYYGNIEEHIDLLNQQNKENQQLKQQLKEYSELGTPKEIDDTYRSRNILDNNLQDANRIIDDLVKQLHDLPKKIVEEVEKNFTEYLPLKDKTGAGFYVRLNAILRKYGGENE